MKLLLLGMLLIANNSAVAQNPRIDRMCCVKFSQSVKPPEVCKEILADKQRCEPIRLEYREQEQTEAAKGKRIDLLIGLLEGIVLLALAVFAYGLYQRRLRSKKDRGLKRPSLPLSSGNPPHKGKPRPPPPRKNLGGYE